MLVAIQQLNQSVGLIIPEIILLGTACLMLLLAPLIVSERGVAPSGLRHVWGWWSLAAIAGACAALAFGPSSQEALGAFVRGLSLVFGLALILLTWNQADDGRAAELQASLLVILAGLSLVGSATDLVTLFLALELISVPTYLYLLMPRRDAPAQEATIKYFLTSILSSAIMLFGMSYLYGVTGSTNLGTIAATLGAAQGPASPLLLVAAVMLLAGLAFRVTAVPFHFYAPDVFQGCPISGAALLSVVPKVAGLVALIRLLLPAINDFDGLTRGVSLGVQAQPMIWWLAVLSMFLGNAMALLQTNLRKLFAYSSVAQGGYLLVGLYVGRGTPSSPNGIEALLFYLVVYGVMTLGAFAVLTCLMRTALPSDSSLTVRPPFQQIGDLAGLGQTRPLLALMLGLCLLSLTGLPPTAGFLAKFNLLLAAWSMNTYDARWLAVCVGINAMLGAGYYLRIVATMYLNEPAPKAASATHAADEESPAYFAGLACTVATVALFFAPGWLWDLVRSL